MSYKKKANVISDYMAKLGRKGGSTTGKPKARSSDQARRAALVRWEKWRKEHAKD